MSNFALIEAIKEFHDTKVYNNKLIINKISIITLNNCYVISHQSPSNSEILSESAAISLVFCAILETFAEILGEQARDHGFTRMEMVKERNLIMLRPRYVVKNAAIIDARAFVESYDTGIPDIEASELRLAKCRAMDDEGFYRTERVYKF